MTVHKCFKCKKVYDCQNKQVLEANKAFWIKLYDFESEEAMEKQGYHLQDPRCHENYDATCPYCAFEVIFNEKYEPRI